MIGEHDQRGSVLNYKQYCKISEFRYNKRKSEGDLFMEQKFIAAWAAARAKAEALGVKMRPVADADALKGQSLKDIV